MINIRCLGSQPYHSVWDSMKQFTLMRDENTIDELWLLEHPAVYTQGQAGKPEHILNPHAIPVVQTDRGGQVTYHGPGQLVAYVLMDIRRRGMGVRTLVCRLEEIIIASLKHFNIQAQAHCDARGVYVDGKKIASIGLRVKNGCTYHGIALNVAMDLHPFSGINPCGYAQLEMTQMRNFVTNIRIEQVSKQFIRDFLTLLGP